MSTAVNSSASAVKQSSGRIWPAMFGIVFGAFVTSLIALAAMGRELGAVVTTEQFDKLMDVRTAPIRKELDELHKLAWNEPYIKDRNMILRQLDGLSKGVTDLQSSMAALNARMAQIEIQLTRINRQP